VPQPRHGRRRRERRSFRSRHRGGTFELMRCRAMPSCQVPLDIWADDAVCLRGQEPTRPALTHHNEDLGEVWIRTDG